MPSLRIVFAGTPEFSARHLEAILSTSHQVIAVYTQPDRPAGRGKQLLPSPVKSVALQNQLPVFQPVTLKNPGDQEQLARLQPDLLVVVAYGLLLPQAVLDIPRYGCLNVHASLLPRWRGAAPIERAIIAGDSETGITIMQMNAGLDTGPMLHKTPVKIASNETRVSLEQKLQRAGTESLTYVLNHLEALLPNATMQDDSRSTYAGKLDKQDAAIDWSRPAVFIDRQIRAGIGRLPAFTHLDNLRLRILEASVIALRCAQAPGTIVSNSDDQLLVACGEGALAIHRLQLPGKNPVAIKALLNAYGTTFATGKHFSAEPVGNP